MFSANKRLKNEFPNRSERAYSTLQPNQRIVNDEVSLYNESEPIFLNFIKRNMFFFFRRHLLPRKVLRIMILQLLTNLLKRSGWFCFNHLVSIVAASQSSDDFRTELSLRLRTKREIMREKIDQYLRYPQVHYLELKKY